MMDSGGLTLQHKVAIGNAVDDGQQEGSRGWFIGHFIDPASDLRHSDDIEVKWGIHQSGESKGAFGTNQTATTLTMLISGTFILEFPCLNQSIKLHRAGDYVIFGPKIGHIWKAVEESVIVTVRWPSLAGDQETTNDCEQTDQSPG